MRYGGYVLIGLPIILFFSSILERFTINKQKIYKTAIFFLILSIVIFNVRNISRLNKEINIYKYNLLESPYFFVKKISSKITFQNGQFKIFSPIKDHCWASKTPCSNNTRLKMKKFLWMNMVSRNY